MADDGSESDDGSKTQVYPGTYIHEGEGHQIIGGIFNGVNPRGTVLPQAEGTQC